MQYNTNFLYIRPVNNPIWHSTKQREIFKIFHPLHNPSESVDGYDARHLTFYVGIEFRHRGCLPGIVGGGRWIRIVLLDGRHHLELGSTDSLDNLCERRPVKIRPTKSIPTEFASEKLIKAIA